MKNKERKGGIDPQHFEKACDYNVFSVWSDNEEELNKLREKDDSQILTITYDNERIIKVTEKEKLLTEISDPQIREHIMRDERIVIDNPEDEKTIIFLSLSKANMIYLQVKYYLIFKDKGILVKINGVDYDRPDLDILN